MVDWNSKESVNAYMRNRCSQECGAKSRKIVIWNRCLRNHTIPQKRSLSTYSWTQFEIDTLIKNRAEHFIRTHPDVSYDEYIKKAYYQDSILNRIIGVVVDEKSVNCVENS